MQNLFLSFHDFYIKIADDLVSNALTDVLGKGVLRGTYTVHLCANEGVASSSGGKATHAESHGFEL